MKKNATLEILEQSDKVSLYSMRYSGNHITEFEFFLQTFSSETSLSGDYQRIVSSIKWILDKGAFERYFRPEGKIKDRVCALPIGGGKLRLYCLRLSDHILILGNGGIKACRKYQEDYKLLGYVFDLQKLDAILNKLTKEGNIFIEDKTIMGIADITFEI